MRNIFIFLLAISYSCTNKKTITPICKSETNVSITYQSDIQSIISLNCLNCHSNKDHAGGVKLENLADLKLYAASVLYDQIIPFGGNPPRMPKGGKLTDCEISTIKKWIESGLK